VFFAAVAAFPFVCAADDKAIDESRTIQYSSPSKQMGRGTMYSWVVTDMKRIPLAIGVTFTETALFGLPETIHPVAVPSIVGYEIALPDQVRVPPFKHIVIAWDPKGHIPAGVYDVPHLDFHFFMIAPGERNRITAQGDDIARCNKKLPARYAPSGYILPSGTEQSRIGSHWIYPFAPEFIMESFTKTFVYGSYNGELVFLQPMTALTFLRKKPNTTKKIRLPSAYKESGYYPTAYSIKYNPELREYSISLDNLVHR
jgi:hypothetical protein